MTEEEKKAIETLKSWKDYNIRNKNKLLEADKIIKVQETILNLINKLQKENEMLKRCHIQDNKNLDFVMANCILKEKVKDKIEALSKTKSDLATYIAVSERIRALQEILDEREDSKDGEG